MASRRPLVVVSGRATQLPDGDQLQVEPIDQTLAYTGSQLDSITKSTGTKTFAYSGGQLDTISDTETGKISTFNYTGGQLTSITITDI